MESVLTNVHGDRTLGAAVVVAFILFLSVLYFVIPTKVPPAGGDESNGRVGSPTHRRRAMSSSRSRSLKSSKKSAYRLDEELSRKSSSEITRRGMLWSRHASWHLPTAPRSRNRTSSVASVHDTEGLEHVAAILKKFDVDLKRGFLPSQDPLQRLPYARYHIWEDLGDDLSKLLGARLGQARDPLRSLPVLKTDKLVTEAELRRAHLLLCLFAHAYIWGGTEPLQELPEGIAKPLWEVSTKLGIPPVLGHPSIVLYNWRRLDNEGAICMENLATLNNFFDGRDESWFYLITVEVEARGAGTIVPMMLAIDAIQRWREEKEMEEEVSRRRSRSCSNLSTDADDVGMAYDSTEEDAMNADRNRRRLLSAGDTYSESSHDSDFERALVGELSADRVAEYVAYQLERIAVASEGMCQSMEAMQEGCHPFIFYHRVRPFLSAWKDNPILPNGIIYKGVSEKPLQYYGGSAAQSALIPFLDIGLGICHASSKSHDFLLAMREYMICPHREFLEYLETVACIRDFVSWNLETRGITPTSVEPQPQGPAEETRNDEAHGAVDSTGETNSVSSGSGRSSPAIKVAILPEHAVWIRLRDAYDSCVRNMKRFRNSHMNLVAAYIIAQQKKGISSKNLEGSAGGKGTGGTELMSFLKPIKDDCSRSILGETKPAESTSISVSTSVEVPVKLSMPSASDLQSSSSKPAQMQFTQVGAQAVGQNGNANASSDSLGRSSSGGPFSNATSPRNIISYVVPVETMNPNEPYRKDNAGLNDIDLYRGAAYPAGRMKHHYRLPATIGDSPAWCSSDTGLCSTKEV